MKIITVTLLFVCSTLASPSTLDSAVEDLATGNRLFTTSIFKEISNSSEPSVVFSSFSAETVLSLTSEGAKDETRSQLVAALHLDEDIEKNRESFKEILPKLQIQSDNVVLLSANKIYADENVTLEDAFKKTAVEIYRSELENVRFKENFDSANKINSWVADQTNDKIKQLIEPEDINEDTALVLINALYLSAKWYSPFSPIGTRTQKFFKTATDSKDVQMMHNLAYFNYYENADINTQFINIRLKHEHLSMVIALHKEVEGIKVLENNLEEVFKPQQWKGEFVDLKLPKFSISSSINLVSILKSMGVKKLFDAGSADLSGLSANRKNLFVSNIFQKAFINVTETGVEAAAASAILVQTRSGHMIGPNRITFHADHPFIFYIKYRDLILFAGRYSL